LHKILVKKLKLSTNLLNAPTHLADRKVSILKVEEKRTFPEKKRMNKE
jgi:hypothetical protein